MESYAVIWREAGGRIYAGKLELGPTALRLRGSSEGFLGQTSIPYGDILGVRLGRSPSDRLNGSPTVILDRRAAPAISIAAVNGVGVIGELGDVLAELAAQKAASGQCVVVVVPIKRKARDRVLQLIEAGPPFDPDALRLDRHHVFVTEREVIFLFEAEDARSAVEGLVRNPAVWKAAAAWKDVIAGRPRVADEGYSWLKR